MPPDDGAFMRRALDLARLGWGQTAPNPMVGAVLVRDGEIVGEGYHARYGEAHAEVAALAAAGPRARGATAYVTLEPCAHTGHTPPCVDALIAGGVARVVAATRDPHPAAGGGLERLGTAGIATTVGVEGAAARELNAAFFHTMQSSRPWVTLKLATSLDGAVSGATESPRRRWLTGAAARQEVHRLRAGADAVVIGIGTALADDPLLTVRDSPRPRVAPTRIVFDRAARLPLDGQLVATARQAPVLVVAQHPSYERGERLLAAGVDVLSADSIGDALGQLRHRGLRSLLLEGGPRLAGAFLEAAAVDRLVIFQTPVVLGSGAQPAFAFAPSSNPAAARRLAIVDRRAFDDDLMTVYALSDP